MSEGHVTLSCFVGEKCSLTHIYVADPSGNPVASDSMLAIDRDATSAMLVPCLRPATLRITDSRLASSKPFAKDDFNSLLASIGVCHLELRQDKDGNPYVFATEAISTDVPS